MEPTALNSASFDQPLSVTQPSSSAAQHGGLCLPFDEAVKALPEFLQPEDKPQEDELAFLLTHVDELHKPHGPHVSADQVCFYTIGALHAATNTEMPDSKPFSFKVELRDILRCPCEWEDIIQNITTELTSQVITGVDSHKITPSILNVLQRFSWETKLALTTTAFILTFGDKGLNLCPQSKLSFDELPIFVKQLLEITSRIAIFEDLPTLFTVSKDPKIMAARTSFIVAVYWIIRATVATSASHIMAISSGDGKVSMATPSSWSEKFEVINDHIKTIFCELQKLLGATVDIKAYKRIKEIVQKEDHSDNKEVLNELILGNDGTLNLYYGPDKKKVVHLNVFEKKYVLLVLSRMENIKEMHVIDALMSEQRKGILFELIWIPIIDSDSTEPEYNFDTLRNSSWYSVENPWIMKKEVIKFFREDWNYGGEPMIVVLDPQGNIVNQNAVDMMLIWGMLAFPFTNTREEFLWKQETWRLDLLVDDIDGQVREWISKDKYIFIYGGEEIEWIRTFTRMVRNVASKCQVEVEMFYAGKSHNEEAVRMLNSCVEVEKLSPSFNNPINVWYFWRRLECMINSMARTGTFDDVFQEIQRLHNRDSSSVEWAILAKGSTIMVNGHGQVVLSTLNEYEFWKEKAFEEGFGKGFKSHYQELYQKKHPLQRMEFPTAAVKSATKAPETMVCPDCRCQMKEYNSYLCYHPPSSS